MAVHILGFVMGILGNLISFGVYLAPLPTFYRIYRKRSTEGFQSVPYIISLFSAMLWLYYAFVKTNAFLLITINAVGCVIQTIYIVLFLTYAPARARISTAKLLLLLNVALYSLIIVLTLLLSKGPKRVKIIGLICTCFAVSVFVAPLSVIRLVIRTKSVEFLPFYLSFALTISAVVWFFYGLLIKDLYVALPNVLGFLFGIIQMLLHLIYRDAKTIIHELKLPEHKMADGKQPPSPIHNDSVTKAEGKEGQIQEAAMNMV